MALDKDLRDAAKQVGLNAAKAGVEIAGAMTPMQETQRREMIAAIMADIGVVQGVPLEVTGTHLGSMIGAGVAYGIMPDRWPDALMLLYSGGEFGRRLLDGTDQRGLADRIMFVDAAKEIARACLCVLEGAISLTVEDRPGAMKKYLAFLAEVVGNAAMTLTGD